ncbi:hypothetical protein SEPCBS119000_001974 [Sporothrix epigloea]|uniref:N-acetyltransferase domain-containing protein n=1 Tax=Sporothrix epigloea TaxID=1892477 RepID=A0ABP0DDN4_9PEZI
MAAIDLSAPDSVTIRPLTLADRDACVVVENACFSNPDHRATPEKFSYRLTVCPELCLGIFVHTADAEALVGPASAPQSPTAASSGIMVGHIIATRCQSSVVTDASMVLPPNWRAAVLDPASVPASDPASALGHQPEGSTVAVHSLGIVPSVQGRSLGTKLMKAYLERMAALSSGQDGQHKIDRVALICQDYLVDYYTKLGFTNNGPSAAQFGGGGWFDMYHPI